MSFGVDTLNRNKSVDSGYGQRLLGGARIKHEPRDAEIVSAGQERGPIFLIVFAGAPLSSSLLRGVAKTFSG